MMTCSASKQRQSINDLLSSLVGLASNQHLNSSETQLIGTLEKLCTCLKGVKKDDVADGTWIENVATQLISLLPGANSKVAKKIVRALCELEKHDPVSMKPQLLALKWTGTGASQLVIVSSFLEWSEIARGLFADQRLMTEFLTNLVEILPSLCRPSLWTVEKQQHLQIAIKVPLQLFQFCSDWFQVVTWSMPSTEPPSPEAVQILSKLLSSFVYVLQQGTAPKDCMLLSGTALTFFLSLSSQESESAEVFTDILRGLVINGTSTVQVGNLQIHLGQTIEDTTQPVKNSVTYQFGGLSAINGLLVSGKEELLCQPVTDQSEMTLLITWLFPHLCDYCQSDYQYNAFQTLTTWFKKVTKLLPRIHASSSTPLFTYHSAIVQRALGIIWTNLDSPVDGVHHCVMEVFDLLLQLNRQEHEYITENMSSSKHVANDDDDDDRRNTTSGATVTAVMDHVLQMSWHIKGKYGLLASLLKYMDIKQFLLEHTSVFSHLLESMSTNYLAPSGTELFRAIVQQIKEQGGKDGCQELFGEFCLEPTICGLTSNNSLLRHNVNHYWLPVSYKLMPESYDLLTRHLSASSNTQSLHALIALHKTARNAKLLRNLPVSDIERAMCHPDEDVRLDAFLLVCVSVKKAEELSDDEMGLIERCLPFNMSIDSAPFRQQLTACLQNMLVRARDSSLAAIRTSNKQIPARVHRTIKFIDNLWHMCLHGLNPGASFQRIKSSLELIRVILATFSYEPQRKQRKGNTPESVVHLVRAAQDEKYWLFYQAENVVHILSCILHGTDEIRELAGQILLQYFPWPLPSLLDSSAASSCQLLKSALNMCQSAKAAESEGGALLVKLIYTKHVMEKNEKFVIKETGDGVYSVSASDADNNVPADVCMIQQLLCLLQTSVQKAHQNPLRAAKHHPGHGLLMAIQYCIAEGGTNYGKHLDLWCTLVTDIVTTIMEIIKVALQVLGGKVNDEDTAPSFEQMGMAIQETIRESRDGDGCPTDAILSSQHQLLMTWCWINIREGNILLGEMVECLPLAVNKDEGGVLTREDLLQIADIFITVLTKCRHRGAIEGCNVGFVRFCTKLLRSPHAEIHSVAVHILNQVMSQVSGSAMNAASTTRRSAGLPLIVQSIIVSESKTKQSVLLTSTISTLLEVLQTPPPPDHDATRDLPHVHALNILKAIFRESSVAMACMPYIARATMCTIEGFASPYWGIRNGAIQLFGTLVQRMLGQKKTKDDRLNTVTAAEFFTHYPSLATFLLQHLNDAAASHQGASIILHPSLYPILTILAKLGVGIQDQDNNLEEFRKSVSLLLGSPILGVRELATQALLPLVPQNQLVEQLQMTIRGLPERRSADIRHNHLHGSLLLIHKLLDQIRLRNITIELPEICMSLCKKYWLCTDENRCHIVRGVYLRILLDLTRHSQTELEGDVDACLQHQMELLLSALQEQHIRVGFDQYVGRLVQYWLDSSRPDDLPLKIKKLLGSQDVDVVLKTLSYLSLKIVEKQSVTLHWCDIQVLLCEMVSAQTLPWQVLCDTLSLILQIYEQHNVFCQDDQAGRLWNQLMVLIKGEENSRPASLSVAVLSIFILQQKEEFLSDRVDQWSRIVQSSSDPFKAEGLRLHDASALCIAGPKLLHSAADTQQESGVIIAFRLFEAAQQLLMDDQPHIRQEASRFVHRLTKNTTHMTSPLAQLSCMHSNVALQILHDWMCDKFASHGHLIKFIIRQMTPRKPLITIVREEIEKRVEDLFEPEEANAFREDTHIHQLLAKAVKASSHHQEGKPDEYIKAELEERLTELDSIREILHQHGSEVGPLNVSSGKRVYDAMWGQLCLIECLCCHLVKKQSITEKVQSTLNRFCLVSQLHPGLVGKSHDLLHSVVIPNP